MKWIIARNSCSLYELTGLRDYNKSPTIVSPERFLGTVKLDQSSVAQWLLECQFSSS